MVIKMSSIIPIVSTTDAAEFPNPSGTTLSTNRCSTSGIPEGCNAEGPLDSQYPILLHNGYTYWPLSYDDNRKSFALIVTSNSSTYPKDIFEVKGARYIDSIEVLPGNESVKFIGQASNAASVPWTDLTVGTKMANSLLSPFSTSSAPILATSELENELDAGTIAGIVIGCILGAMITVIGGYLYRRMVLNKRKAQMEPLLWSSPHQVEDSESGIEANASDQSPHPDSSRGQGSSHATDGDFSVFSSGPERGDNMWDSRTTVGSVPYRGIRRVDTSSSVGSNPLDAGLGTP